MPAVKAPQHVARTFTVAKAGKQNVRDGSSQQVVEHLTSTPHTVSATADESVLVCEDSTGTQGIYTVVAGAWLLQADQPKRGDLIEVTGGTSYAGGLFKATGLGTTSAFKFIGGSGAFAEVLALV